MTAKAVTISFPLALCDCDIIEGRHYHITDTDVVMEAEYWRAMKEFVDKNQPGTSGECTIESVAITGTVDPPHGLGEKS